MLVGKKWLTLRRLVLPSGAVVPAAGSRHGDCSGSRSDRKVLDDVVVGDAPCRLSRLD